MKVLSVDPIPPSRGAVFEWPNLCGLGLGDADTAVVVTRCSLCTEIPRSGPGHASRQRISKRALIEGVTRAETEAYEARQ